MLQAGDQIGITACSNGQGEAAREKIQVLLTILQEMGLKPVCSPYLYAKQGVFSGSAKERGAALMTFYKDKSIKAIFDISGGDIANEVLDELDFEIIRQNPKIFCGYSDLTTLLNAIYAKTEQKGWLYQLRHLVSEHGREQCSCFKASVLEGKEALFKVDYQFIQGHEMDGVVIGGNIRCFLKLAGTPFMPSFKGKVLFLEAMGGETAQMTTYLSQLRQMNAFREVKGILLGTFTAMEREGCKPDIVELLIRHVDNKALPIAKTNNIGHGTDAKALVIGEWLSIKDGQSIGERCLR